MSVYRNDDDPDISSEDMDTSVVVKSNGLSKPVATSPDASSTASESPTPTNSVHEKNWYTTNWQNLASEEQRQLLGTEEESSDRQSDCEVESDVWEITQEQREYYKAQFLSLQPDSQGLLGGHIARSFFEKSKLPVTELRKIWQLSDVSKDGALSLEEFNTAMHLVVLRRNHIPLPDVLPPALVPSRQGSQPHKGKQWTKFVESPTNSVSSPGPKPVNFDFPKPTVDQDPKIHHPVALRVTPGPETEESEVIRPIQRPQPKKQPAPGPGALPPPPAQASVEETIICGKKDPPPPPPPRPYRHHTRSSSLDLTRLGRTSHAMLNMPPTVPPRISPGTVSPRKQPNEKQLQPNEPFANFAQFQTEDRKQVNSGAFQVYRKPEVSEPEHWSPAEIPLDVSIAVREAHNQGLRQHCHQLQKSLIQLNEEKAALQVLLDKLTTHD